MNAMLLCAGLGTRFRPQTEKLAKPALPFLGMPLAAFGLYYVEKIGIKNLVVNTHHLPKTVESAIGCLTHEKGYKTCFTNEAPNILGSGGGIKNAEQFLKDTEPFVVINGDEVILSESPTFIQDMIAAHKKSKALVTLLTMDHPGAGKDFGAVRVDGRGKITGLSIKGEGADLKHNCGVYVYDQRIFNFMPAHKKDFHIFKDCLEPAMARGELVNTYHMKSLLWLDTSDEKSYVHSTREALKVFDGDSPFTSTLKDILKRFHQGFEVVKSSTGTAYLGVGAKLGLQAEVEGFAVLSPNAQFDQGIIKDSVIGLGLHIHEMVGLKNQLLV